MTIHEGNAAWFISWKDDLAKDDEIRSSELLEKLQKVHSAHPTSHLLGISLYAVMVGDLIVNPKDDPVEAYADVQAFRNFSAQVLKVAKKDIPAYLTSRFDKLTKDRRLIFHCFHGQLVPPVTT